MTKSNEKTIEDRLQQMEDDIRDMRNDIATIKGNTTNIDRISTLTNTSPIIKDIMSIIGDSKLRAAVLYLTKNEISAQDLAAQIGQDPRNLVKFTGPFTGKKGYIIEKKIGRNKYFVRGDMVDLVNIDDHEAFAAMIKSWESKRATPDVNPPMESMPVTGQTEQKLD